MTFFLGVVTLFAHKSETNHRRHTFIMNKGQWPDHVVYKAEIRSEATIYFEKNAIHYQFIDIPYDHPHGNYA